MRHLGWSSGTRGPCCKVWVLQVTSTHVGQTDGASPNQDHAHDHSPSSRTLALVVLFLLYQPDCMVLHVVRAVHCSGLVGYSRHDRSGRDRVVHVLHIQRLACSGVDPHTPFAEVLFVVGGRAHPLCLPNHDGRGPDGLVTTCAFRVLTSGVSTGFGDRHGAHRSIHEVRPVPCIRYRVRNLTIVGCACAHAAVGSST